MKNLVKSFDVNNVGRDFVIGDLHGAYILFEDLLKHLNFDPAVDRMFSVGDLIDRGPESLKCLKLLNEPWFHCVISNHEQMMIHAFNRNYLGNFWVQNGGQWGLPYLVEYFELEKDPNTLLSEGSEQLFELIPKVNDLPVLITVNLRNGKKIHIIHAELPPKIGGEFKDEDLADPYLIGQLALAETINGPYLQWGRSLYVNFYGTDLSRIEKIKRTVKYSEFKNWFNPTLSHIISGHTIVQRPFTIYGQTNIDTGAYAALRADSRDWSALTCVNLNTWEFIQVNTEGVRQVHSLVIDSDE